MKISKITIKQLFGIKEWQGDGKNIELVGDNGTGKTSVIDAIRYALTNSSDREFIVKNGETEGEIYIETDNGLSIDRKARTAMTDYKSVKQNGNVIPSPESFLKTIFTPLQLSPMEFISMDKKTQNATILDMIQYDWNLDTIKEWFGEIPRDVNYEQNILAVLNDIQAENGYYFMHRQDVNRDIRAKKAVIADIGSSLPIDYDGERWEKENLSDLYTEIEKIRKNNETIEKAKRLRDSHDGKIRSFQADKEIKIPVKIKIDSADGRRITDLKTVKSITETFYAKDLGQRLNFCEWWGYDLQAAVYREIYRQNTEINTIFPVCSQIRTGTKYGLRDTRLLCRLSSWAIDGGMTP